MNVLNERRAAAIRRIEQRRNLAQHVVVYAAVNTLLVVIWVASGAGAFWPIWPIVGWGIGLALHAWAVLGRQPITEREIEDEIEDEIRREVASRRPGLGN